MITGHAQRNESTIGTGIGFTGIPAGFTVIGPELHGEYATLKNNDGKLFLVPDKAFTHGLGEDFRTGADTTTVRLAHAAGNEWDVPLLVDILDDAPEISAFGPYVLRGETVTGALDLAYGADGPGSLSVNGKRSRKQRS